MPRVHELPWNPSPLGGGGCQPILIPASAQFGLILYADRDVLLQEQLRIRVILHGIFKNVIEVG